MRRLLVSLAAVTMIAVMPVLVHADDQLVAKGVVSAIKAQQSSGAINEFSVDLQVEDGVVWLKGSVKSLANRDSILNAAAEVAGVKKVVNDITIREAKPDKTEESGDVFGSIAKGVSDAGNAVASFFGSSEESSEAKPKAERLTPMEKEELPAKVAPPVQETAKPRPSVAPKIERLESILTDDDLARAIGAQLEQQKALGNLKTFGVKLSVNKGVVWVGGSVGTAGERALILDIAKRTKGIQQVVDRIAIAAPAQPQQLSVAGIQPQMPEVDDQAIANAIGRFLNAKRDSGELGNFNVYTSVSGGTVWMRGRVASRDHRDLVLKMASEIDGVIQVVNELDVQLPATIHVKADTSAAAELGPVNPELVQVAAQQQIQAEPQVQPATPAPANPILQAGAALAAPIALASNAIGMSQPQLEQPNLPGYAWPTYAPYPNYGAVTYPRQYSPSAWPYIGPFYPYPQVPLGWRKVTLEWDDGWWFLNFKSN